MNVCAAAAGVHPESTLTRSDDIDSSVDIQFCGYSLNED